MKKRIAIVLAWAISGCANENQLLADLKKDTQPIELTTCQQVLDAYKKGQDIEPYVRLARTLWMIQKSTEYGSAAAMSKYQADERMGLVIKKCINEPGNTFIATYALAAD
ncbi:hypothetical protein FM037_04395 [Shewanella psychropiezotolerans]|uniref:Lipoprotein n=1 Tax=Shewanella psychropiezotolerans TaxID=2593655 RepID=A0ABX5WU50_9GAMM|nr:MULTISPECIES: hypothetical protein [Shewanella]MPY22939.1 hypothetical protein [Shewanella sp. YLB-07]QDO82613.1 hypothetical protein FM037_04395 [Shewanella psychropiezotolerans]